MKTARILVMLALVGCGSPTFEASWDADGNFHGTVRSYWPNGQLAEQSEWNHGAPISGKFYSETGVLNSEIKKGTGWRHCPGHSEYYRDGRYVRGQH